MDKIVGKMGVKMKSMDLTKAVVNRLPAPNDFNSINKIQESVGVSVINSTIIEPMDLEEMEFLIMNDHQKL